MTNAGKSKSHKRTKHRGRQPGAKDRRPRKNKGRRLSADHAAKVRLNGLKGGDPTLKGPAYAPSAAMEAVRVDLYAQRVESAREDLRLKQEARAEREGKLVTREYMLHWQRHLVASIRRVLDDLPAIALSIDSDPTRAETLAATMKEASKRIRQRLAAESETIKEPTP
jgi:hypothetical protein